MLNILKQKVLSGNFNSDSITLEEYRFVDTLSTNLLNNNNLTDNDISNLKDLIIISNLLYNNDFPEERFILTDGVYDILLVKLISYTGNNIIGAKPIDINSNTIYNNSYVSPATVVNKDRINDMIYSDIFYQKPNYNPYNYPASVIKDISKKNTNVSHKYNNLVGTLDKCKFTLNSEARDSEVFDNPNVQIFERDFLSKHIQMGLLNYDDEIELLLEIKYDGISVEAEVTDRIISARSRGDVANDLAADLTPVLENYRFINNSNTNVKGMKFEAIITKDNLFRLSNARGREYKNARNAIIGLFSLLDAYLYKDYITMIPLALGDTNLNRVEEIEYLNKYYANTEKLRYTVVKGNYVDILFKIKTFVNEIESLRDYLPFMYDGIVVSYLDKNIINTLGRENNVNKYSMAIKFNPLSSKSIFLGYSYTVGQSGVITPMIHFTPVEFFGTIHNKATGHSYERFRNLNLALGDTINVSYNHDVMAYVTKDETYVSESEPVKFITKCPSCNLELLVSKSFKTAMCINMICPGRNIARVTNMFKKLNIKDFAEETFYTLSNEYNLSIYFLTDILNLKISDLIGLGEVKSQKLLDRINEIRTNKYYDYQIMGAIGFSNIASEKWKTILSEITLDDLFVLDHHSLIITLDSIKGIGKGTIDTIVNERDFFEQDICTILNMDNIISSKDIGYRKTVRYTGVRDSKLTEILNSIGFDASDTASVTNSTDILIVPHKGFSSTKVDKAIKNNTIIIPIDEISNNPRLYL